MEQDSSIIVKELSKEFVLPQHKNTSLKQAFVNMRKSNVKNKQKALEGINFEVKKGEFFGIVGRNGSGKSTLLKILAGVYSPTKGTILVNGSLTPFIELGVGFNPQLSGRDNVFLNGALLGFNRKEMQAMYDDIVEFAELERFMDQKLKNYSSGMQVRLAFSIAIKARNEILIFDEVLAVGDEAFQRKCFDVFEHYKADKQTVILVTHDMETVKKFCNRALLLSEGKMINIGNPRKIANEYSQLNQEEIDRSVAKNNLKDEQLVPIDSKIKNRQYLKVQILDNNYVPKQSFKIGSKMIALLTWDGLDDSLIESLGVHIMKESGEHITGINTRTDPKIKGWQKNKELEIEFDMNLTKGKYHLVIEAFNEPGSIIDTIIDGPQFSVIQSGSMKWSGLTELSHTWRKRSR
jgi:ABC-type polysaccharide/polyol phosphate transport system ATPase subunit